MKDLKKSYLKSLYKKIKYDLKPRNIYKAKIHLIFNFKQVISFFSKLKKSYLK